MAISAKAFRAELKSKGIFYTDEKLAKEIRSYCPQDVTEVYDPTCGDGSLLRVFGDDVMKYGQDILPEQVACAEENIPNFFGVVGDTLMAPAFLGKKFDCIVANPPFSIKWDPDSLVGDERFTCAPCMPPKGKADYAFLLHILYYLSDDGVAVCLNFPGILYRGQREGKLREWLIRNNFIDKVIHIPGGHFDDTAISTCILVLKKNRTGTDVVFIDTEKQLEHVASFDEIEKNGFSLSVNLYCVQEIEVDPVDPVQLQVDARASFLKKMKSELTFDLLVCKFESDMGNKAAAFDFLSFLDEVQTVIDDMRRAVTQ